MLAIKYEEYNILKDFFGTIVLQTDDLLLTPQDTYEIYKGRWDIETYYDYLRNEISFNAIGIQDYYEMQGYSFIMLISSIIEYENDLACQKTGLTNLLSECYLEARSVKIHKSSDTEWIIDEGTPTKTIKFLEDFHIPHVEIQTAYNMDSFKQLY